MKTSTALRSCILRNLSILIFCLVTFDPCLGQAFSQQMIDKLRAKSDTLLNQGIEYGEHMGWTAGISVGGSIVWEEGAGKRDAAAGLPAQHNMIHRIASIAKPMTAIAIMQLVEQGKIDLDATLQTYVPEFPVKPEGTITVRQLLTHTSGINAYRSKLDGFTFREYPTLVEAMGRFKDRKLVGTPGEVYQYTTYGYVVLGVVIEKVSGLTYAEYMKKHIWEPAGMTCTGPELHKVPVDNKSRLYRLTKQGKLKKDLNTNISMKLPGGGLQSTVGDLLRFGEAVINGTLVSAQTLAEMMKDPGVRPKESGNPYGMGWFLYGLDADRRVIGHSGGQAGTTTQLMILPDQGVVVACISNTRGGNNWGNVFDFTWKMIDYATKDQALDVPIWKPMEISTTAMDRLTGKYDFGKGGILEIYRKGGQLHSDLNQFKGLKLYAASDSKLFYRNGHAHFEFIFDESGQIAKTVYTQQGKEYFPKRLE